MGKEGLEPSPRKRHNPKSCASANSATPPNRYVMAYPAFAIIVQFEGRSQDTIPKLIIEFQSLKRLQDSSLQHAPKYW